MKKTASLLSALAILCNCAVIQPVAVKALEASTYTEFTEQMSQIQKFPDPDQKYISVTENNLEFRLYDKYAVLSDCNDREITEVEIPSEISGLPVVGSFDTPFGRCRNLKKIILPDTFEHISWADLTDTTITTVQGSNIAAGTNGSSVSALDSSKTAAAEEPIPSVSEVIVSETNPYYTSVDGIIYTKDMKTLIGCPPAKDIKEVKISEKAERIGDYAFIDCFNIEKAVIPSNIKHINNGAFLFCINLKTIEIPESITSLSGDVCYGCKSLENVSFNGKIEKIGFGAFGECLSLETFDIPETVTYIGSDAFESAGCYEDINGIYYIDKWVVGSSEEVENADIKEGTIGIAEASFFTRNKMNYISIPSSVSYLGYISFGQLSSAKVTARMDYRCSFIEESTIAAARAVTDFYIYDENCDIFDSEKTIPTKYRYKTYVETDKDYGILIDGKFYDEVKIEEDTVIHGYAGSTAQAYAEKYSRKFELIEDSTVKGDANCDGDVSLADAVLILQSIASPDVYGVDGINENHITELGMINADVFETDSGLTPQDALSVQKYLLRLISELPE